MSHRYIGFQFDGRTYPGLWEVLARAEEIASGDLRKFDRPICGLLAEDRFRGMPQYLASVKFDGGGFEIDGLEPADAPEEGGGS